ncbi:MAG TPA: response regulator [Ktedonobacteraceae bacterium]|nr:response regulator [Ktedonobacteraceae bacterium]
MARKILIVDDAPAIVHAVSQIPRVMGYEVIAADGNEVMQIIAEQHPDLLLLDIWMSGCDGRDICKQIKGHEILWLTPVLLFSAHQNVAQIVEEVGADGYILKPFRMRDLLATIATTIEQVQNRRHGKSVV